jgi:isoquinoline 1-oxidoreductase beta subunit
VRIRRAGGVFCGGSCYARLNFKLTVSAIFTITRRDFLRALGVGSGALVFGCSVVRDTVGTVRNGIPVGAFVAIHPFSGDITIFSHRSEMGQGIKSSLAAVLADEAEFNWERVTLRQANAELFFSIPYPYEVPGGTSEVVRGEDAQLTDSSRSMALYYTAMRLFGCGIKLVMLRAAVRRWKVDVAELRALDQTVLHERSGRSIEYHHLLLDVTNVKFPDFVEIQESLKSSDEWKYIAKRMPFSDADYMVTGKAIYGADVRLKGMLTAMIVRCPVANGALKSFDATAALAVRGVKFVEPVLPPSGMPGGVGSNFMPHAGVAVIAEDTWAAWKGRAALKVEWDLSSAGSNAAYDSNNFRRELEESTSRPGKPVRWKGDAEAAMDSAAKVMEAGYYVPHLAQTPMEPPVAVALYDKDRWELWCPTQAPERVQHYVGLAMLEPNPLKWLVWDAAQLWEVRECERETLKAFNESLARMLGVDENILFKIRDELKNRVRDKVIVHVTLLGGSFGRKLVPDYAIEAAFLAKQHRGVPIRVQWSREDDVRFSYYNPVSHQYFKAGLTADGRPAALLQRSAFSSSYATLFPPPRPNVPEPINDLYAKARAAAHNGGEYPYGSANERGQGLDDNPYAIENLRIENSPAETRIRTGCMRSGAHIYHAFGLGSFADELAIAAGRDSKDYLLDLLGSGRVLGDSALRAEHVTCYENNLFPLELVAAPFEGGLTEIFPGYPPDTRRLRAVIERVARGAGWDQKNGKLPKGRGLGIAAHMSRLTYVAIVIDVSLNGRNELTINEVHAAYDCGLVVNPDRVQAQLEGSIIYGLSLALFGNIIVKEGAVVQKNFDDYPVLRIHQSPKKIFTYFTPPSPDVVETYPGTAVPPTGIGEPATPVVAPALANAIVAAGGPRIREIPFSRRVVVL